MQYILAGKNLLMKEMGTGPLISVHMTNEALPYFFLVWELCMYVLGLNSLCFYP